MKRIGKLLSVVMIALVLLMPFNVLAKKKTTTTTTTATTTTTTIYQKSKDEKAVNVYVFYSSTCQFCQALHAYLAELKENKDIKDKFNVVDYEVSSQFNKALMLDVADYFNHSIEGIPLYVIGDQIFEGFGDTYKSQIVKAIEKAYDNKKYKDYVAAIESGDLDSLEDSNDVVGIIVLGICVVIIIALIVCSSKNKYYEDEEDEEEKTAKNEETKKAEVKKEEPKKEVKKSTSTTKKAPAKKETTSSKKTTKTSTTKKITKK